MLVIHICMLFDTAVQRTLLARWYYSAGCAAQKTLLKRGAVAVLTALVECIDGSGMNRR